MVINSLDLLKRFEYGQLFWWQENRDIHTLITFLGKSLTTSRMSDPPHSFCLTFALFNTEGQLQIIWQQNLGTQETIFIDSATCPFTKELQIKEGVLAVFIEAKVQSKYQEIKPKKLGNIIDWYSDTGEMVTLHSDQLIQPNSVPQEWTEITIQETETVQNFLVILNGFQAQPSESLCLSLKNHLGQEYSQIYVPELLPFSLHKLYFAQLFPDIQEFADNCPITVTGTFASKGVFIRPYVMTQGKHLSGYHGGDRYFWQNLPSIEYKMMGQGEVNPMFAIHRNDLTTTVNLFNTHGELETDFWVDATLYNQQGKIVNECKRWLKASRHHLSRGEIQELLPSDEAFVGHIALRFSPQDSSDYPRRLQALLEYRTPNNVSRVMAWSDVWNWSIRKKMVQFRLKEIPMVMGYFRVWWKSPFFSYLSLTNCGIQTQYQDTATYCLRLENPQGNALRFQGKIAPQGTVFGSLEDFFPDARAFLEDSPVGIVVVESQWDLAALQLTHNIHSGVWAAEHFLPIPHHYPFHSCGS